MLSVCKAGKGIKEERKTRNKERDRKKRQREGRRGSKERNFLSLLKNTASLWNRTHKRTSAALDEVESPDRTMGGGYDAVF